MNVKKVIAFLFAAVCFLSFAACDDEEGKENGKTPLQEEFVEYVSDSTLQLVKAVNYGLCYDESELPEVFRTGSIMERVGDTLNLYQVYPSRKMCDSVSIRYFTQGNKLLLLSKICDESGYQHEQIVCYLTRKYQFLCKSDLDYVIWSTTGEFLPDYQQ